MNVCVVDAYVTGPLVVSMCSSAVLSVRIKLRQMNEWKMASRSQLSLRESVAAVRRFESKERHRRLGGTAYMIQTWSSSIATTTEMTTFKIYVPTPYARAAQAMQNAGLRSTNSRVPNAHWHSGILDRHITQVQVNSVHRTRMLLL